MHTWDWHSDPQGRSYLTCSVLQDWQHGFFTRHWAVPPEQLVAALGPARSDLEPQTYRLKQVHGKQVLAAAELTPRSLTDDTAELAEADGLVSTAAGQAIWVCTADCTPMLIGDRAIGQVAAIHAGWRGTALQIGPETVAKLQAQGSRLQDLRVAMGPAIAGEVYQVSTTVAAQVGATLLGNAPANGLPPTGLAEAGPAALEEFCTRLYELPDSPVLPDPQPGRARLDVRQVNALQLTRLGLTAEQIAVAPYCTYQTSALFFSYRRDAQKKVQWSGIVSQTR